MRGQVQRALRPRARRPAPRLTLRQRAGAACRFSRNRRRRHRGSAIGGPQVGGGANIGSVQIRMYPRETIAFQPLQAAGDRIEQLITLDRLVQEIVGTQVHALAKTVAIVKRGQENHRDGRGLVIRTHRRQHAEAIHVRHLHI